MNNPEHVFIAFLIGLLLGGAIVAFITHQTNLRAKIDALEESLHERLTDFENSIAAHFRHAPTVTTTVTAAPPPAAPPPAAPP
ncbi:MAG: hypothetical protein KGL39_56100, partial [Patescibacteria group bacterium]|nr:hypothetical protein [Patescibacteria group bacterium]